MDTFIPWDSRNEEPFYKFKGINYPIRVFVTRLIFFKDSQ